MLTEPRIEYRKMQEYAAIVMKVSAEEIPARLPPLIPEVFAWLEKKRIKPVGPPFFEYLGIDQEDRFLVLVGVPVPDRITDEGRILGGDFPPGNYACLSYFGDYRNLKDAHMALEDWIKNNGWMDTQINPEVKTEWLSRSESYVTDPKQETNPDKWETRLAFLLDEIQLPIPNS